MSIDPMCEKYYWISPYVYCKNNPIIRIDPDGRDDYQLNRDGTMTLLKKQKMNFIIFMQQILKVNWIEELLCG
jgi:hypothetical protein